MISGGTLVSRGAISVGDLTSLLLYTVYVGSGLQMLTYAGLLSLLNLLLLTVWLIRSFFVSPLLFAFTIN